MKTRKTKIQIQAIAGAAILLSSAMTSINVSATEILNGTEQQGRLMQGRLLQGQQVQGQQVQGQQLQGVDIERLKNYTGTVNDKLISDVSAQNGQLIIRLK